MTICNAIALKAYREINVNTNERLEYAKNKIGPIRAQNFRINRSGALCSISSKEFGIYTYKNGNNGKDNLNRLGDNDARY